MTTSRARSNQGRLLVALAALALALLAFGLGLFSAKRDWLPARLAFSAYEALFAGGSAASEDDDRPEFGRWNQAPGETTAADSDSSFDQLAGLGYASGTQLATALQDGVVLHEEETAWPGLNLIVSGHAPEASLLDMQGKALHRWRYEFFEAFPDSETDPEISATHFWRRARMLDDGGVLAIFEGQGLIRLDAASNLLWAQSRRAHHDLDLDDEGRIWVLTRKVHVLERIHPDEPVLEDFVTILDPDGNVERDISLLEAFERSDYAPLLDDMAEYGDVFHTNSLAILDGAHAERVPAFAAGHILLSMRDIDTVAVLDPDAEEIVWAMRGLWRMQHDPHLLPNGHLLVFDNQGHGGRSKVVEVDPLTQEIAWMYADGEGRDFYTMFCGTSQRLSNGNTLIVESEAGRAVEVTPDFETVWRYENPHRAGPGDTFVATLLDIVRLPDDLSLEWIDGAR